MCSVTHFIYYSSDTSLLISRCLFISSLIATYSRCVKLWLRLTRIGDSRYLKMAAALKEKYGLLPLKNFFAHILNVGVSFHVSSDTGQCDNMTAFLFLQVSQRQPGMFAGSVWRLWSVLSAVLRPLTKGRWPNGQRYLYLRYDRNKGGVSSVV